MVRLVAMCCHEWEPVPTPRAPGRSPGTVPSVYQPFRLLQAGQGCIFNFLPLLILAL